MSGSHRAITRTSTSAARDSPPGRRPIENTDVVLWYTLGSHHITRPEDWPVMTADRGGFMLKSTGFFDHNPVLNMAPSQSPRC
jgi:primary-amine oxidase